MWGCSKGGIERLETVVEGYQHFGSICDSVTFMLKALSWTLLLSFSSEFRKHLYKVIERSGKATNAVSLFAFCQLHRFTLLFTEQAVKNHGYNGGTAVNSSLGKKASLFIAEATPSAPTAHNCCFTNGPALPLNLNLYRCPKNPNSMYTGIQADFTVLFFGVRARMLL